MAPTPQGHPPRRPFEETRLSTRPSSHDLPTPEFLSLTYTLPYHLVEQVNETARITNRSRSEILADAIRQYMDGGAAQPDQSHVATYEEYSYQETGAPTGAARYDSADHQQTHETATKTVSESTRTEFKAWAARTKRTRVSTYESYSYEEVSDDHLGQMPPAAQAPPVLDVTPAEPVQPPDAPPAEAVPAPAPSPEPASAPAPPPSPATESAPAPSPAPAPPASPAQPEAPVPAPAPEPAAATVAAAAAKAQAETEVKAAPEIVAKPELVLEPEVIAEPEPVLVPDLVEDPAATTSPGTASAPDSTIDPEPEPKSGKARAGETKPQPDSATTAAEAVERKDEPASSPTTAAEATDTPKHPAKPAPNSSSKEPARSATKPKTTTSPASARGGANAVVEPDLEPSVDKVVDPAARLRKRLEGLSGEPLDSKPLERCLGEIMRQIDKKDFSPPEHSSKVATMARDLAAAKGMRGSRLHEVYIAGLVHDIGKACVPDEIIKKPKPSSAEMALIRRYPEFGADLLGTIPAMQPVAQIVAAHQERWNGSGYPQGAVRTEIPVAAQIVALCDVYDVLSTARRYRPAYSQDRALQIIKQNVGTLWNPDIARVFLVKIVGEGPPLRAGASG